MSLKMRLTALVCTFMFIATPAHAFWPFTSNEPEPTPVPVFAQLPEAPKPIEQQTDESSLVRVLLRSLGQPQALGLSLEGIYSIENDPGFRFDFGSELAVAISGNHLLMRCGGLTINMGTSFTLTRHPGENEALGGIAIHETDRKNLYTGDVTLSNVDGNIQVIVTLDVEDYLCGVIPYEMSDSFPIEALKAQAVAARTYVMSRKSPSRAYDVVDTPNDQVYRGFNPDTENTILAVNETRGVVGFYKEKYATCYFTASNGGQTAMPNEIWGNAGDYGWLDVRDDPFDLENPSSPVKSITFTADWSKLDNALASRLKSGLTEALSAKGLSDELSDISVTSVVSVEPVDPKFGEGNRMFKKLRVGLMVQGTRLFASDPTPNPDTTPMNQPEILAEPIYVDLDFYGDLKPNLGLKISSIDCEVLSVIPMRNGNAAQEGETPDTFVVESRRFGHGVGMSQRGAQQMARDHDLNWTDILAFYYPGMTLTRMNYAVNAPKSLAALPDTLGRARPRPTPKPTPAPLPPLERGQAYAKVSLGSNSSTLNVRSEASTSGALLGTLDNAQRVIIVKEFENGWAQIKTTELSGFASMDYLIKE